MQANELRVLLVSLFPAFEALWESPDNVHRDGAVFTPHGLCSEFSAFFVDQPLPLDEEIAAQLFDQVEEVVSRDPNDLDSIANALCTCFLENIAGTSVGEASLPFMGPASRRYFESWHPKA